MRLLAWILFALLCVSIGFYPLLYLLGSGKIALLESKSDMLLSHVGWRVGFYAHIVAGGIALLLGWTQFVKSWRTRYPQVHRSLGKLYIIAVCISGVAAVGIAPFATSGWIAATGFGSLGIIWLYTTLRAYLSIRQRDFLRHERMMVYSYAACFAAVTLRIWLPLLIVVFQLKFNTAYPIVAWLSWVPNLLVANWIVRQK